MQKVTFIFGFLSLMLIGCPTRTVLPTNVTDAGTAPSDAEVDDSAKSEDSDGAFVDNCSLACTNLRKPDVHCTTGTSVDGGEDCTKSCRHARDSRLMPLDIPCATKARSPQEAHICKGWGC